MISEIFGAFKDLARLIGLPFFIVLMGFFIMIAELFILGVTMLFALWRIRKEMIDLNRKIDLFALRPEKQPEKQPEKEPEREPEEVSEKEAEKKKYRYKWK